LDIYETQGNEEMFFKERWRMKNAPQEEL